MSLNNSLETELEQLHINRIWMSPGWTRVAVVGEVDLNTSSPLRAGLLEVLADRVTEVLELDLSGLTFLDCGGLNVLLDVRAAALESGCQVLVSHPQPQVARVLEVTDVLPLFSPWPTPSPRPQKAPFRGASGSAATQPSKLAVAA